MTRMIAVSTQPRKKPANMPMMTPPISDTETTTTPMNREKREPKIRRDSMSRPSASVPSRKMPSLPWVSGGIRSASRNCWSGSNGAKSGAAIATITSATNSTRPATAPWFSEK